MQSVSVLDADQVDDIALKQLLPPSSPFKKKKAAIPQSGYATAIRIDTN